MKPRWLLLLLCSSLLLPHVSRAGDSAAALRPVVTADTTDVHPDDVFAVKLGLENLSSSQVTIRVPDTGWDRFWKSSNRNVTWDLWDGDSGAVESVEIPPHTTYVFPQPLKMFVDPDFKGSRIDFRMGFKTGAFRQIVWSAPISLNITP